ncbi:hypothetical protein N7456_010457 [Penicillium angulare]|uniref:Amino acid/polyamine transporter I n=1 Tax=Penicillium angulare TaxID=116970 RepID=A0A9W9F6M2_9EURO|nr:hypothetical protein N7456_010457 [Penicillium angulare]
MAAYEMRERALSGGNQTENSTERLVAGNLSFNRDENKLRRLGKTPSLQRNFDTLSLLSFSCILLVTWEAIVVDFDQMLGSAGPKGVISAYMFVWIGTGCSFVVLSELSSMAPTAGGQYHWCAMLAPSSCMELLSYVTGWLSAISWQVLLVATNQLCGTLVQNLVRMSIKGYRPTTWKRTLIGLCMQLFAVGANLAGGKFLPSLETFTFVIHVLGYFGILIPVAYMAKHKSTSEVFGTSLNSGNFSTHGLAWFVGLNSYVNIFGGGDAAVHMAEEVENAAVALPQALMLTILIDGCMGLGMIILLLYSDIRMAIGSWSSIEIFYRVTGSARGAIAMSSVCTAIVIGSSFAALAPASRQLWSLARDRVVKVSSQKLPTRSILLVSIVSCLLSLLSVASPTAFAAVTTTGVTCWNVSYLTVQVLLLYRRCRGQIASSDGYGDTNINIPGAKLVWGPFRVPGIWGTLINGYAVVYTIIIIFFSFWPDRVHPGAKHMSYTVVSTFVVVMFPVIYYYLQARHVYKGPVKEIST